MTKDLFQGIFKILKIETFVCSSSRSRIVASPASPSRIHTRYLASQGDHPITREARAAIRSDDSDHSPGEHNPPAGTAFFSEPPWCDR